MKYIIRIWLAEYSSVYNVCCEVISLFPGQLCYLLSLSLSSPAITPSHLCNFQWLPFTTLIWCTCMSPITATCFVYLTPVSPELLLLTQRVWQHFLVILCTVCDLICFAFLLVSFILAKWEILLSGLKKVSWHSIQTFLVMLVVNLVIQIQRLDPPLQQKYPQNSAHFVSVNFISGLSGKWGPHSVLERSKSLFTLLNMSLKDYRLKGVWKSERKRKLAVFCE